MLYYFIGGPWNNRLYEVDRVITGWRVPVLDDRPLGWVANGPITLEDCQAKMVDYYPDKPLLTGVSVMSSLWGYNRLCPLTVSDLMREIGEK
jgi:hypothetical protein